MTISAKSWLASLAFWRSVSFVLVLTVALLLVLNHEPGGSEPPTGVEGSDARASLRFVELLWFGEDQELRQLHGALEQMLAGETETKLDGRGEEVRRLFEQGGPLYERREIALALLLTIPAREQTEEEDTFQNTPFPGR
jgi:hypothetical protein